MADYSKEQFRDALLAFMNVISTTVVVWDETENRKASAKEFLETGKQAMEERLNHLDGADVKLLLPRIWGYFETMVHRGKYTFEMKRAIDEMFEE